MRCPYCGKTDIRRMVRQGMADSFNRWLGRWPFRCSACTRRFYGGQRSAKSTNGAAPARKAPVEPQPADIEVSARPEQSSAAILVRAETPQQLDNILLALANAVQREQCMTPHEFVRS